MIITEGGEELRKASQAHQVTSSGLVSIEQFQPSIQQIEDPGSCVPGD